MCLLLERINPVKGAIMTDSVQDRHTMKFKGQTMNIANIKKRCVAVTEAIKLRDSDKLVVALAEAANDAPDLIAEVERLEGLLTECHEKHNGVP